jgi:hypothetical protein
MTWIIEKRKNSTEIWVTNSTGFNGQLTFKTDAIFIGEGYNDKEYKRSMELAQVIVKALNKYEQTEVEQEGWVCRHCGKSTFETEYDYLADIDEHLGCALEFQKLNVQHD